MRNRRYGKWPAAGNSPAGTGSGSSSGSSRQSKSKGHTFNWPAYMDREQLSHAMKRGHVFRAKFRLNAANRGEAFCTLEGLPSDVTIRGDVNQNRAVEGDEVAVAPFKLKDWFVVYKEREKLAEQGLLPEGKADPLALAEDLAAMAIAANDDAGVAAAQAPWTVAGGVEAALKVIEDALRARPDMRVTGKVVAILEPSPRREAIVGVLLTPAAAMAATAAPSAAGGSGTAALPPPAAAAAAALAAGAYEGCLMLVPLDPRLPKGLLTPGAVAELPEELRQPFPCMSVRTSLGPTGDIEAGTAALLAGEGLREQDFSLETYACLPKVPWSIPPAEAATRADFSSWRIFSIDPITARDLDDALSMQPLGRGRWRLGVHIADVASFVRPGTALDDEAQARGTSVYLVQRVLPMLPRLLCEQLCSLQPGDPKCAFSIVWEVDADGHIYREWAGRSIINSCAKLAYPMVQQMIEGCFDPGAWQVKLFHGVTWEQVVFDCMALHGVATRLRSARFGSGALRLTNTKLSFALDTGGNPVSTGPYVQAEANHLVEEFMLLANMRVAGIIARAFPAQALLRRHPPPSERKLGELKAAAEMLGVKVDSSSAGALQASLNAVRAACQDDAAREVIMLLATKPMQLAQYFCTGDAPEPSSWRHYALAMNLYTHFTSPIRRYPDVIVHRLLQAALELQQQLQQPNNAELLTVPIADTAELPEPVQVAAAPNISSSSTTAAVEPATVAEAGEAAAAEAEDEAAAAAAEAEAAAVKADLKLYLCIMLKQQPVVTWAVVAGVRGDRFFTAYVPEFGFETKMYLDQMGVPLAGSFEEATQTLTINSSSSSSTSVEQQQDQQQDGFTDLQQHRSSRMLLLGSPGFSLKEWLQCLKQGVVNRQHIEHAQLPLQLRVFSRVPVVVGTVINRATCHPTEPVAKLWVDCGMGSSVQQTAAAAGAAQQGEAVPSAMAYETLLED
ncbi:exoribonuclease [Scenedesmus sp. NREL 46B-D3]|nr:exoribonuclease [Scenedesmus sp. NREL 46B-D3]